MNDYIALIHDRIFKYLIEKNTLFRPRIRNTSNRFESGYWFLGNEEYLCVGFWNGNDHDRKVPNIHLQIYPNDLTRFDLVLSSRSDDSKSPLLKEVAKNLNCKKTKRQNEWIRAIPNTSNSIEGVIESIENFINNEKDIIDEIVSKHSHETLNRINLVEYETWIVRILKFQGIGKAISEIKTRTSTRIDEALSRKGREYLNDNGYIRSQIKRKIKVIQKHKIAQNEILNQLIQQEDTLRVVLEENYIDLLIEYDDLILIVEMKTSNSASKCIRDGIGQLLEYYHKNIHNWSKEVKLCIAGPSEVNEEDSKFLSFINESFKIEIDYLSFDGLKH